MPSGLSWELLLEDQTERLGRHLTRNKRAIAYIGKKGWETAILDPIDICSLGFTIARQLATRDLHISAGK